MTTYTPTTWANGVGGGTPLSADNLQNMETGIANAHSEIAALAADPVTKTYVDSMLRHRNRIINGCFSVNQREFSSSSTSNTYGFDRWNMFYLGGTVSYSAQTAALGELPESAQNYVRITTSQSAAGDYAILRQPIESVRSLSGKQVTVSFWARAASGTPKVSVEFEQHFGTGGSPSATARTYAGQATIGTGWVRYSVTATVPSIAGKTFGSDGKDALLAYLWMSGGSDFASRTGSMGVQSNTFNIWGVQVEEGATATPFEQRAYAEELRACQRYFWRHKAGGGTNGKFGTGLVATSSSAYTVHQLPVPMRAAPALEYTNQVVIWDGTTVTAFSAALDSLSTTSPSVGWTSGAAWVAGRPAMAVANNTANAYMDWNAEL